jgi:microcystin degradation protein MlrC
MAWLRSRLFSDICRFLSGRLSFHRITFQFNFVAQPSGVEPRDVYEAMRDELLETLCNAGPVDVTATITALADEIIQSLGGTINATLGRSAAVRIHS